MSLLSDLTELRVRSFTNTAEFCATFPEPWLFRSCCSILIYITLLPEWMKNLCKTLGFTAQTFSVNYIIYFSQFWAWKGFSIPDACQHCACLNFFFFQQTTKIYITALFRVHFNLLGNYSRDVSSYNVLLMCQPDVTSLTFSHVKILCN